jgi:hypothetical protein
MRSHQPTRAPETYFRARCSVCGSVGIARLGTHGEINRFILLDHLRESFAHLGFSLRTRALQLFAIYKARRKFYIRGMGANSEIGRSPYLAQFLRTKYEKYTIR